MATQNTNKKSGRKVQAGTSSDSILEALRGIGGDGASQLKNEASEISKRFFDQMLGWEKPAPKASGGLSPGQSIEINQVLREQTEENKQLRSRLAYEQSLRAQESQLASRDTQEVKLQVQALSSEIGQLAQSTNSLAKETKIAAMQAPVTPGVYHITFFESLRSYIVSFRKKIENASLWLQASNQRSAKKKGFWGQVGKSGAKRLLSSEDYAQRSAG